MFPGRVLIGSKDIAKILNVSVGHMSNKSFREKMPFKLVECKGRRMQVSIIELARYLDEKTKIQTESPVSFESTTVLKRKLGRPVGSVASKRKI